MSTRSDAALSLAGGILGGLAVGTWIARRYLAKPITTKPYSQEQAVVTSITNLKGAKP